MFFSADRSDSTSILFAVPKRASTSFCRCRSRLPTQLRRIDHTPKKPVSLRTYHFARGKLRAADKEMLTRPPVANPWPMRLYHVPAPQLIEGQTGFGLHFVFKTDLLSHVSNKGRPKCINSANALLRMPITGVLWRYSASIRTSDAQGPSQLGVGRSSLSSIRKATLLLKLQKSRLLPKP